MPIVNHVVLASGAAVAVSVAVATAMAIYESPELRRYADDVRRRIAIALHSMGDGIQPSQRKPRFNRPEDADGFLVSSTGVDADDETRRRQREELLYWNSVRLREQGSHGYETKLLDSAAANYGDAEAGAYVFSSGADARHGPAARLRHRGEPAREGMAASPYANPFADENCISHQDLAEMKQEAISDIYSATTRHSDVYRSALAQPSPVLVDTTELPGRPHPEPAGDDEHMSAGQEDAGEAYASIQAWAHNSSRSFYSPLPVMPGESEPVSDGQLTPTDSASLAGWGDDMVNETRSSRTGDGYDVMSETEDMLTPASWFEVGSVVSGSDGHLQA